MNIHNIAISYLGATHTITHTHNEWEMVLNLQGSGTDQQAGVTTPFYPGTITVCPPGVPHSKTSALGVFQDIYITFDGDPIFRHLKGRTFEDDPDQKVRTLLLTANSIYHNKERNYQLAASLLVEAVCNILLNWDENHGTDERVALLKNVIIEHFTNPAFKIGQGMDQINYCDDYVRRCFKKEVGMTPVEYLNLLRIDHAKKLLQQKISPHYLISDVAYLCGFYDTGYFSRVFKKLVGVSPAQFSAALK